VDTSPGFDVRSAQNILAEIGIDMKRFFDADHLASWAGVAPGNNESGGNHRSGRTSPGDRPVRRILLQAAWTAARTKGSYLSALYNRLALRRGKKRAILAVAHSLIVSLYHMLTRQEPYRDLGANYFDERKRQSVTNNLIRRLEKLGYQVKLETKAAAT
jgi:transposase